MAEDLALKPSSNPVRAIQRDCEARVRRFPSEFPDCRTLTERLQIAAAKLGTIFEEAHSDDDLEKVRRRYLRKGERGFAGLHEELSDTVFGITLRRAGRKRWERRFVSVIDCREAKRFRPYFTKWHEPGHLWVLADQTRFSFRRTHTVLGNKDPEETMVDIIAGAVGFLPELVRPLARGKPSFEKLERIRKQLCPEASRRRRLASCGHGRRRASCLRPSED